MKFRAKTLDTLLSINSEQVIQRIKMGDLLERARPVDHFALFPKHQLSDAWILRIRDDGFEVRTERIGFGGVKVIATTESSLEPERVDDFVTRMFRQVTDAGGYYQGWDGPLVLG
jgi:hypothetical protein